MFPFPFRFPHPGTARLSISLCRDGFGIYGIIGPPTNLSNSNLSLSLSMRRKRNAMQENGTETA